MTQGKILLVKPSDVYPVTKKGIYNRTWMPISLANCAAMLENEGFECKIVDAHADRLDIDDVAKDAKEYDKIFVTSTDIERWECPGTDIDSFIKTSQECAKVNPNVYVIGVHGSLHPQDIIEKTHAKAVIKGEPEESVLEICQGKDLHEVKGISFKNGTSEVINNEKRKPMDMTILPTPAYHLLDSSKYFYEVLGKNFALFEGSRGCYYGCKFCLKEMFGNPVRSKKPEQMIKEVDEAVTKHGVKTAQFIDLEYTLNKDMYMPVLDHLIEKNYDFKWCCQARADNLDEELLVKMKKAGCVMILCGIESGSEKTLKSIRKGLTLEKVKRGIATAKKVGIDTCCFFMFGFPGETKEDMKETIKFTKELNPTYVSFHDLIPHKTTDFFHHKDELDNHDLAVKMRRLGYLHFYLRPSYIAGRLFRKDILNIGRQLKLFWGFVK
mgnify:CR=1 FL=1